MNTRLVVLATSLLLTGFAGCTSAPAPKPAAQAKPSAATKTTPSKPVKTAAAKPPAEKAASPTPTPAPVAAPKMTPAEAPTDRPAPKFSAETQAVVARFTSGIGNSNIHELSGTTGFPEAMGSLQPGMIAPQLEDSATVTNLPPAKGLTADGNSTQLIERDWTGLVLVPVNASLAKAYTTEVRLLKVEAHPLHDGRVRIWTRVQNQGRTTLRSEVACQFRMRGEITPDSPYFYELDLPPGAYRDVFFVSGDGEVVAYTVLVRSVGALQRN